MWKGFQRPKRLEFERETLTDRFGPWPLIAICTVTGTGTLVSFAFADSLWWILLTATFFPLTLDALWGPSTVMLTRVVPEELPFGEAVIKPLRGGETLRWRMR